MGPEFGVWLGERGLYAGGFRPGDVVINTFLYHLVPAALELDEALHLIGCTVVPTGVGNTDTQVTVAKAVGATGYVGTPRSEEHTPELQTRSDLGRRPLLEKHKEAGRAHVTRHPDRKSTRLD